MLGLAAIGLSGCAGDPAVRPTEATAPLPDQPSRIYTMSVGDFAEVVPWAFNDAHWAIITRTDELTAYSITGLTPEDRPVVIRVRQVDDTQLSVWIKVGQFGDEQAEQHFLQLLQQRTEWWRQRMRRNG